MVGKAKTLFLHFCMVAFVVSSFTVYHIIAGNDCKVEKIEVFVFDNGNHENYYLLRKLTAHVPLCTA